MLYQVQHDGVAYVISCAPRRHDADLHHRLREGDAGRSGRGTAGGGRTAPDRRACDAGSLAEHGIDYVHLRALGTPAEGREAARKGKTDVLARVYAGQLELPEAIAQAAQMLDLAAEQPSALLCYEREPGGCHRTLLLDAVAPGAEIVDLFPRSE